MDSPLQKYQQHPRTEVWGRKVKKKNDKKLYMNFYLQKCKKKKKRTQHHKDTCSSFIGFQYKTFQKSDLQYLHSIQLQNQINHTTFCIIQIILQPVFSQKKSRRVFLIEDF